MTARREFLRLAAGTAAASLLHSAPARKPNLLVILADDMGFADARCYGGDVDTPNLDRLAAGDSIGQALHNLGMNSDEAKAAKKRAERDIKAARQ